MVRLQLLLCAQPGSIQYRRDPHGHRVRDGDPHTTLSPAETPSSQLTNLTGSEKSRRCRTPPPSAPAAASRTPSSLSGRQSSRRAPSAALDGEIVFLKCSKRRISFSPLPTPVPGCNSPAPQVKPGLIFPSVAADRATAQGRSGLCNPQRVAARRSRIYTPDFCVVSDSRHWSFPVDSVAIGHSGQLACLDGENQGLLEVRQEETGSLNSAFSAGRKKYPELIRNRSFSVRKRHLQRI